MPSASVVRHSHVPLPTRNIIVTSFGDADDQSREIESQPQHVIGTRHHETVDRVLELARLVLYAQFG
jgi:hypothetical protein